MSDRVWLIILFLLSSSALLYFLAEGGKVGNWFVRKTAELTGLDAILSLLLLIAIAGMLLGFAILLLVRLPKK